jgi:dsRNA-specific ribonuclease
MATTVEALIGAVFTDSQEDLAKVRKTLIALGILEAD